MVVAEYEQEELADDSEDEKRIRKAQDKAARKKKQLAQANERPRLDRAAVPTRNFVGEDKQLFRGKLWH